MTPTNAHSRRTVRIGLVSLTVATCLALAACSGGGDSDTAESEPTPTTAVSAATTPPSSTPDSSASTTAANVTAPGAVDELDDLDEDGEFDPRCGTADLGGGLIVETLCSATLAPTPEEGVIPLPNSLLTLPSPPRWEDLAGVDAVVKVATRLGGGRVPALEFLFNDIKPITDAIIAGNTDALRIGMQQTVSHSFLFEEYLYKLYKKKIINLENAREFATDVSVLDQMLMGTYSVPRLDSIKAAH